MKPFEFIAVKLTLFLVSGILLGYLLDIPPKPVCSLALLSLCFLGWTALRKSYLPKAFALGAVLSTLLTGMVLCTLALDPKLPRHYSKNDINAPGAWQLRILDLGKENKYYQVYTGRVLQVDGRPVRGKIRLLLRKPAKPMNSRFKIDDELMVWGSAREIPSAKNNYQWDYSEFLRKQNIHHQLQVAHDHVFALEGSGSSLKGWASSIRRQLINKLEKADFGDKEFGIIKALLLGQRADIAPETIRQYQRAGAMHILAISGLHIGIILLILRYLFQPLSYLPKGRYLSLAMAVIALWIYALITGFSASVIRATAMFSFLAYTLFLNRLSQAYNTLALSMFFLLVVVDPLLIFQVGFQMSYAAVMAILWVYPALQPLWKPRSWFLRKVWQLIVVSLSAQLGVLPISLYYFHQFPALFLISSLVIIPSLGIILGGGILISALSLLEKLPAGLAKVYNQVISYMNDFVQWVSEQEAFFFEGLSFDHMDVLLAYAFLISLMVLIKKPSYIRLRNALCLLFLVQAWGLYTAYQTRQTSRVLIMHQYNNSVLMHQHGTRLSLHSSKPEMMGRLVKDFRIGARIKEVDYVDLNRFYQIGDIPLVRPDTYGIPFPPVPQSQVWLSESPRINLDRYIAYHQPSVIIADGSNPNYLVERWKKSCKANKVAFHYTGEAGSYSIDLSP